ncbi:MAG: FAD:protein FMN transferase [Bacteroidetes bacterium]|nr:FAD:protein FMN transferase [Bacteroidota bacterium]
MLAVKTFNSDQDVFRRSMRLMGSNFEISVVGHDAVRAGQCIDIASAEITRVEKLLSAFNDDSPINEINRNAGIKPVKASAEIFRLIERSLSISDLTQGTFDISYNVPDAETVHEDKQPVKLTSYKQVILDPEKTTVFLKEKGMRIGFSAVSKGYASDRAKYILQMAGVSSGVINADGDLLTWGLKPDGLPWTIASADPEQESQPYARINISNMAVAKSGNLAAGDIAGQPQKVPGADSKKDCPDGILKSVSVVSPSAELSDAMATPVMQMGVNAGLCFIDRLQQLACVIIDDHDHVYTSREIDYLA